jgi:signal transduction histidine kinase
MKRLLETILLAMLSSLCLAQHYTYYALPDSSECESARAVLKYTANDTVQMVAYHQLTEFFAGNRDSCYYFSKQEFGLARKLGFKIWEADALDFIGFSSWRLGNYSEALQCFLDGIKIADDPASEKITWGLEWFNVKKDPRIARLIMLAQLLFDLSTLYEHVEDEDKEFVELSKGEKVATENHDAAALGQIYMQFGSYYLSRHMIDTAIIYLQRSVEFAEQSGFNFFEGDALNKAGNAYLAKGDYVSAKKNFLQSVRVGNDQRNYTSLADSYVFLANLFIEQRNVDSALYYSREGLPLIEVSHDKTVAAAVYSSLSSVFETKNDIDSAFKYQGMALAARDSLNNAEKVKQFENIGFNEELHQQELQQQLTQANLVYKNRLNIYILLAGLVILIIVAGGLWRRNVFKQRSYALLQKQKQETDFQKTKVEKTLEELKSMQAQLIQSEKMASLGELTAGIAHEIQNPLNFVNNFSEVNNELISELVDEVDKGNYDEVKVIAVSLKDNEEKISHHGKRADAIVKGMLQHSRASTGKKEATDINALADEYLRLSYHGMRARDKSLSAGQAGFNAEMKTDFDENIGKINVVPQDIGRVLLNVFNNAFYTVNEKQKAECSKQNAESSSYAPRVTVVTKKLNDKIEIKVSDNGNGVPSNIVDKIFQPFFTTKPTGQGTGLGLSLAYDIIKAHSGEIKVETKESEGTTFNIQLPV